MKYEKRLATLFIQASGTKGSGGEGCGPPLASPQIRFTEFFFFGFLFFFFLDQKTSSPPPLWGYVYTGETLDRGSTPLY